MPVEPRPYPGPAQYVTFANQQVPAGALRFISFAFAADARDHASLFNDGRGYLTDYTWNRPDQNPPYGYGVADMGYGPNAPDGYTGPVPGTVMAWSQVLALPEERRRGMTLSVNSSLGPAGHGRHVVRDNTLQWGPTNLSGTPRRPVPPPNQLGVTHQVTIGKPYLVTDTLTEGQVISEEDLRALPLETTHGAIVVMQDDYMGHQGNWLQATRFRVFMSPSGEPVLRYQDRYREQAEEYLDSEDPNEWSVVWPPSRKMFIVYKLPAHAGQEVAMPAAPGAPQCPLCHRYAAFVLAGGRHRTVPNGNTWCLGDQVARGLNGLLSVELCPRCTAPAWRGTVLAHPSGVTGCPTCRTAADRLWQSGALPQELRFGVELETECISHHNEAAEVASKRKGWSAKADGSLRGPIDKRTGTYKNAEVISPPLYFNEESMAEVMGITESLRNAGARHAERTGLHVHVGMEALPPTAVINLVELWYNVQGIVYGALPPWGYRARFCNQMPSDTVLAVRQRATMTKEEMGRLRGNERYQALNLNSLLRHGTVEFRFFNGTLHRKKVQAYIEFCVRMVSYASRATNAECRAFACSRNRPGMLALLDRIGFAPGSTSQRWHLLGTFATDADRPGPPTTQTNLRPVVAPPPVTPDDDEDEDMDDRYDD